MGGACSERLQHMAEKDLNNIKAAEEEFVKGKEFYVKKMFDEAIEAFTRAFEYDPDNTESYDYLELAKAAKATISEINYHVLTAQKLAKEGDYEGAQRELDIILDYDSKHEKAHQLKEALDKHLSQQAPRPTAAPSGPAIDLTDFMLKSTDELIATKNMEFVTYFEQFKQYLIENRLQAALKILQKIKEQFPEFSEVDALIRKISLEEKKRNVPALFEHGQKQFQTHNYHQAQAVFKKIVEQYPQHKDARRWLEKTQAAIAAERDKMKKVMEQTKSTARPTEKTLQEYAQKKEKPESEPEPEQKFQLPSPQILGGIAGAVVLLIIIGATLFYYPRYRERKLNDLLSQADLQFSQGRYDQAALSYQQAYTSTNSPETLEKLGTSYYYAQSYKEATKIFDKLLNSNNASPEIHYYLGKIHLSYNDPRSAEKQFLKAIELNPHSSQVLNELADISIDENNYEQAITYLSASLESTPDQRGLSMKIARCYRLNEQFEQANEILTEAVTANPFDTPAWRELGFLNFQQEKYSEAIEAWQKCLSDTKKKKELYLLLGSAYEELGHQKRRSTRTKNYNEAVNYYKKCLFLDKKSRNVVLKLAALYSKMNNDAAASRVYTTYLESTPKDGEVHYFMGALCHKSKKYREAFNHYKRAAALEPGNARIWANLGTLYGQLGHTSEAKKALEKSLDLDPDQPKVKRYYKKLK